MLVLTRSVDQRIVVGDPSKPLGFISVQSIRSDRVRIGLEFPDEVPIHREEVAYVIASEGGANTYRRGGGRNSGATP